MKHLTIILPRDAARVFALCIKAAAQAASTQTANTENNYPALTATVLNDLLFKISKQMWTERAKYKFNITLQHKLALVCAWDDGFLMSRNEWTLNLLRQIIAKIDPKISV